MVAVIALYCIQSDLFGPIYVTIYIASLQHDLGSFFNFQNNARVLYRMPGRHSSNSDAFLTAGPIQYVWKVVKLKVLEWATNESWGTSECLIVQWGPHTQSPLNPLGPFNLKYNVYSLLWRIHCHVLPSYMKYDEIQVTEACRSYTGNASNQSDSLTNDVKIRNIAQITQITTFL